MAITRAKATALLNKTEMGLFDDSRSNAVRGHSEARLNQLVMRARTARDRARDLEKRQRLASRGATGSKSGRSGQANARTGEKIELLTDILARFEARQVQAAKTATSAGKTTGKTAKTSAAKKATKTSAAKKTAKTSVAKTATKTSAAKKTTTTSTGKTAKAASTGGGAAAAKTSAESAGGRSPVRKTAAKSDAGPAAKSASSSAGASTGKKTAAAANKTAPGSRAATVKGAKSGGGTITPEKALKNTRKLLKARKAEAQSAKPWETIGVDGAAEAAPEFQSPRARSKVLDLHAAEIRQTPIQGSISTRGRKSQGKRDNRNSNDNN